MPGQQEGSGSHGDFVIADGRVVRAGVLAAAGTGTAPSVKQATTSSSLVCVKSA